jgi:hypothetical protein
MEYGMTNKLDTLLGVESDRMACPRAGMSLRPGREDEKTEGSGKECDDRRTEYCRSQIWMWATEGEASGGRAARRTWDDVRAVMEMVSGEGLANLNGRARGRSCAVERAYEPHEPSLPGNEVNNYS